MAERRGMVGRFGNPPAVLGLAAGILRVFHPLHRSGGRLAGNGRDRRGGSEDPAVAVSPDTTPVGAAPNRDRSGRPGGRMPAIGSASAAMKSPA